MCTYLNVVLHVVRWSSYINPKPNEFMKHILSYRTVIIIGNNIIYLKVVMFVHNVSKYITCKMGKDDKNSFSQGYAMKSYMILLNLRKTVYVKRASVKLHCSFNLNVATTYVHSRKCFRHYMWYAKNARNWSTRQMSLLTLKSFCMYNGQWTDETKSLLELVFKEHKICYWPVLSRFNF